MLAAPAPVLAHVQPQVLARLRHVPSRATAAVLTFGAVLGVPGVAAFLAAVLASVGFPEGAVVLGLVSALSFIVAAVVTFRLIFVAKSRLAFAEQRLYAGDFDAATLAASSVKRWVFRADYQLGALYTLALSAERLGAFREAAALWLAGLGHVPAFAAPRPGARARALMSSHAALCLAAAGDPNDLHRADLLIGDCHRLLAGGSRPAGAFDVLFDDSGMGAIGINTLLVEVENRREPRPLVVLAQALVAHRRGRSAEAATLLDHERHATAHLLAPHERALAEALYAEAILRAGAALGGGPHRVPSTVLAHRGDALPHPADPTYWAALALRS